MYRYLVFAFYSQYPSGGMNDIVQKTNSIIEAVNAWDDNIDSYDYVQIYDCDLGIKYDDIDDFKSSSK
jgi:hypothetical protein